MDSWHTQTVKNVFLNLQTSENGLTNQEAQRRLKQYGYNKLIEKKKRTALKILLEQFASPLVILLIIATAISAFLELLTDAIAIGLIIVINALLGFYQEYKAEKAIEALKKYTVSKVLIIRNNETIQEDAENIVPGDIVLLEEGSRIPADLRLIETINLETDEASLTGESTPIEKITDPIKDAPVADRKNMAFLGTLVSYGRGKGIVVSTGMLTEFGKIASLVQEAEEPTPLQRKLKKFSKQLGILIAVIAAVIFVVGYFRQIEHIELLLTSISLAVAAVPEGLPAVTTITLSIGVQRLSKKNSIMKRLAAVEALGSVTVIAADKTGTMTSNEMTVKKIWAAHKIIDVTGTGFNPEGKFLLNKQEIDPKNEGALENLMKIGELCNDSILKHDKDWHIIGDPTEGALRVLTIKAGLKYDYKRLDEIPFSSERKKMTTVYNIKEENIAFSKGGPEIVLEMCDKIYPNRTLDKEDKEKILKAFAEFAQNGLRVLGFAYKHLPAKYEKNKIEEHMTFVGLSGMIDPARKETIESIKLCKEAGIRTIMITGDHVLTAKAVAKEVGIIGEALSGEEIDKLSDKELSNKLDIVNVFARISPEHKRRIVDLLRQKGHVASVTGDGVNDAPALKKADIGVAMGIKGTDVSKEAADMILLDDNFATIVKAIEEGRGIYDNIKKFVRFLLSANFGEVMIISLAMFLALPLPLLPIHLLWINLVTDGFPALALGVDPKEKDIMKRKPRDPKEGILSRSWVFIFAVAILSTIAALSTFILGLPDGIEKARTMALTTVIFFELFLVFNVRSEEKGFFRMNPLENKKLLVAVIASIILQLLVIYLPFLEPLFKTDPLSLNEWMIVLFFSSFAFLALPEIFIKKLGSKLNF